MRILLATRNAKKLVELRRITEAAGLSGVEIVGLADVPEFPEAPETGATFAANALAKARDAAAATGLPAIADDSGITVDALNGMPGIFSARWSGRHGDDAANLALLLGQTADVPDERRGASFVCAAALVTPEAAAGLHDTDDTDGSDATGGPDAEDSVPGRTVVHGTWRGTLLRAPRGENGFGYDPIFAPEGDTRSSAELSAEEKDAASHRGTALRALVPHLQALLARD
ncbi:non-canonical purine NTP pyrophosphatase [Pseudonocardia sp. HH130629-09]|uniref:non-canonical purine NTP pyrophosphatase n=1 Tax=Pseudonocardia sp. HH130629-09 TaxID=1641402 RepID=UPI0006CB1610|nr:non-canonical purine NTP pyrophosphatase [Pseudonocardia sp. HH130629-09]ALE82334.1 nucleoside-triphosphate diphosphatase [Pseudonocardia sp. HH130629-09]